MAKITIHDVADRAGVSISTVHQALNGKKGVSEKTRKRIQDIASELGYQPNPMASNLKRKAKRIAMIIPNSTYHGTVWKGARDYLTGATNLNLDWTEMPFGESGEKVEGEAEYLDQIYGNQFDGILITGHSDLFTTEDWQELRQRGIAVSLIGADQPASGRIFCVQPDYAIIGRTMAELVLSRIPTYGSIVLCAGNPRWQPHASVVQGFEEYLKEIHATNRIYRDNSWNKQEESYRNIVSMVSEPDVAACCSVLSQSSVLLGRALLETGKSETVFAVGSDLSEENVEFLQQGVFNNLIQKNPYAQGYLAAKNLVEYLTLGKQPEADKVFVGSEVVFRSNVSMYRSRNYRSLLR